MREHKDDAMEFLIPSKEVKKKRYEKDENGM